MISFMVAIIAFNFGGTKSSPIIPGASQGVVSVWAVILFMSAAVVLAVEFVWSPQSNEGIFRRLLRAISPIPNPQVAGFRSRQSV
jgi:hypothetical protein